MIEYINKNGLKNISELGKKFPLLNIEKIKKIKKKKFDPKFKKSHWSQKNEVKLFFSFLRRNGKWKNMYNDFNVYDRKSITTVFHYNLKCHKLENDIIFFKILIFEHSVVHLGIYCLIL